MSVLADRAAWVFDLDNTLYPAHSTVYDQIGARMTAYVQRLTGLDAAGAAALQEQYFREYGATVVGLARRHACDPEEFMRDVHDVSLDDIAPDPDLARLLAALNARRFVFTNGAHAYARRVLARLGIAHLFERVIALDDIDFAPKPDPRAFDLMVTHARLDPTRAVMVEDHTRNLEPAAALGFATVLIGREAAVDDVPSFVHHRATDIHHALRTLASRPATADAPFGSKARLAPGAAGD